MKASLPTATTALHSVQRILSHPLLWLVTGCVIAELLLMAMPPKKLHLLLDVADRAAAPAASAVDGSRAATRIADAETTAH